VYVGDEYGKLIEIRNIVERGEFLTPCLIFI
jgi:ATP-dependent RNA helicase DDX52/ROK1